MTGSDGDRLVTVVGAAADRYGADAMLLYWSEFLISSGQFTLAGVVLPECGPLEAELTESDVAFSVAPTVVVRKALKRPKVLAAAVAIAPFRIVQHVRHLRRSRSSFVVINTITIPLWVVAAVLAKTPVVVHVHEIVGPAAGGLVRRILYGPLFLAKRVICVSEGVREDILAAWPGLADRLVVALNANFRPVQVREDQATYDFVVVGRLSPRKGQQVVLEALRTLPADRRPAIAFAGTTYKGYEWYEQGLRQTINEHELPVTLVGYLETDEAYALAPRVIVPSVDPDPAPLVVIEALSAGRAVIASDCGGIPELLGGSGILVPAGNPEPLAAALRQLASPWETDRWRRRASARAEELSPTEYWSTVMATLETVL